MSTLPVPASIVLAAGLAVGVAGNLLLRAPGPPALNFFLLTALVAVATVAVRRGGAGGLSREAAASLCVGVLFAATFVWRDSPSLKLIALAGAVLWFSLPAFRAGGAWIRDSQISGYIVAGVAAVAHTLFGAALVLTAVDWDASRRRTLPDARWRQAAAVGRGAVIAVPLIIVFGGLFISADAVFAGLVADTVQIDLETLASHVLLTGFLGWIAVGYLHGSLKGAPLLSSRLPGRPMLGVTELGTALGLVGLLFAVFVIVQLRYLFGGSALIHVTPDLTYAEYARRGFFELVGVVVLMVPLLLAADWSLRRERPRDQVVFRTLAGVQIVLVLAVLASALQRMRLYQVTYGLTESRFYATAMLLLLGLILVWFTATVLRGRRKAFAFGTLLAVTATAFLLAASNPQAIIARTNIARGALEADVQPLDVRYMTSLSADAVPVLMEALPALPAEARCEVARHLLQKWPPGARMPLRTWNWSDARARREVREREDWLRSIAPQSGSPAPAAEARTAPGVGQPPRDAPPAGPGDPAAAARQDRSRPSCYAAASGTQPAASRRPDLQGPAPEPGRAAAEAAAPPA